jgi:hypothetical protein
LNRRIVYFLGGDRVDLLAGRSSTGCSAEETDRMGADFFVVVVVVVVVTATFLMGAGVVATGGSLIFLVGSLVGLFAGNKSGDFFFGDTLLAVVMFLVGLDLVLTGVSGSRSKSNGKVDREFSGSGAFFFVEPMRLCMSLENKPWAFSSDSWK